MDTIHSLINPVQEFSTNSIQGDSGEKVNILGGDSIGHCEKKKFI
jgi:hypothetical protein